MNCINAILVVKVGLEVEFLSGSPFSSFLSRGSRNRTSKTIEERAEIKGVEKRRAARSRDKEEKERERMGHRAPVIYEQREFGHPCIENRGAVRLLQGCRVQLYQYPTLRHKGDR